jgi:hypothetical protein
MLLRAHQPQMIGAAALHEAQIVGVIDDAGKKRVDVIATAQGPDFAWSLARCSRDLNAVE